MACLRATYRISSSAARPANSIGPRGATAASGLSDWLRRTTKMLSQELLEMIRLNLPKQPPRNGLVRCIAIDENKNVPIGAPAFELRPGQAANVIAIFREQAFVREGNCQSFRIALLADQVR